MTDREAVWSSSSRISRRALPRIRVEALIGRRQNRPLAYAGCPSTGSSPQFAPGIFGGSPVLPERSSLSAEKDSKRRGGSALGRVARSAVSTRRSCRSATASTYDRRGEEGRPVRRSPDAPWEFDPEVLHRERAPASPPFVQSFDLRPRCQSAVHGIPVNCFRSTDCKPALRV